MNEFNQGIFYAAALLVTFVDQPTCAADILEQAGLLESDIRDLDDTEQRAMRALMTQEPNRVKLTGFTIETFCKNDPCPGCHKKDQGGFFCNDCVPI